MRSWYHRISRDPNDFETVYSAIEYFDQQYQEARVEADRLNGKRLIEVQTMLPGIVGYRYEQMKELESISAWLEIREDAALGIRRRHYAEHYNRALSDRMIEKYAEADSEVIALRELRSHVAAICRKYDALSRQHEWLHWQLTNITKLRVAGMEDAIL